jgi:rRNA methylase, putative, group 3
MVPEERLSRLTRGQHQGVIAFVSEIEYTSLEQLIPMIYEQGRSPFVVLLDGLTDVRNFGAIARTAECAGVDALIIPERGSVSVTADAIKTSAGALHRLPVCRVSSIASAVALLQQSGLQVVAASEKASDLYTETDLRLPLGLVLGAEDHGVSTDVLRMVDHIVRIPQVGAIGSLNVSVAAGILIYEVVRQAKK